MTKTDKPNILIFMTDQQRGDTIYPYNRAYTPNLDKFCKEGITFSNAFCPSPHCCPSRATFFTGLYPSEHGVWNNVKVGNALSRGPYEDVCLWSEDLKDAGYKLNYSGKWHVSATKTPVDYGWEMTNPEKLVQDLGDKESAQPFLAEKERWDKYKGLAEQTGPENRNEGEILRPGFFTYTQYGEKDTYYKDQKVVNNALEIIRSREEDGSPWCQYVGPLGPHDPYYVPKKYLDMFAPEDFELPSNFEDRMNDKPGLYRRTRSRFDQLTDDEHRNSIRHYMALCTYEDHLFGQILEELKERGELDNTLVIYLSDHGDYAAEHGLWCKGLPCFKGAYHIPAVVRWPGGIKNSGRIVEAFVSLADFAPTILETAGVKVDRKFTGQSLVPFFNGEEPENWRDAIFTQTNGNELYGIQRSIMTDKWKYVYNGFDFDELYDLENDPDEVKNLASDPEYDYIVKSLMGRIWRFAYEHKDSCVNSYITVSLAPYGPVEAFRTKP